MSEIIESYLISEEFATLIANADNSGLTNEDLTDFKEWKGNTVGDNEYLVLSSNEEIVWDICDITNYHGNCICVNKMRITE